MSPYPSGEESHFKAKLGGGNSKQFLLHMSSCPHCLALTPWLIPLLGGAVSPQMAAPSSDGCREERPGHVSLRVAVEGAHGPEGVSWVPRA